MGETEKKGEGKETPSDGKYWPLGYSIHKLSTTGRVSTLLESEKKQKLLNGEKKK